MALRRKHIRTLVNNILDKHGINSPPVPLEDITEALGVHVRYQPTKDDLSGFLYQDPESNIAIIGVNSNHPTNRKNFTIAHELGHYLLHDVDEIHVDRQFKVRLRSRASSEGVDIAEKEANLFAAELLMPAHLLEEDIEEVDVMDLDDESFIRELADRYGVSTQAMTFRLAYLGHVQL